MGNCLAVNYWARNCHLQSIIADDLQFNREQISTIHQYLSYGLSSTNRINNNKFAMHVP